MSELRFEIVLSDDQLDALAAKVAEILRADTSREAEADRWLISAEAAAYLGLSRDALKKLTAARALPFEQAKRGARCYFRRSELDAWRSNGG